MLNNPKIHSCKVYIDKLTIYKNSEFAGILQRTAQGCELQPK